MTVNDTDEPIDTWIGRVSRCTVDTRVVFVVHADVLALAGE